MGQISAYFRAFEDGDIIALWGKPDGRGFISSYQHMGQHSDASPELIDELRPATESEKAPLLAELRRIGYDVTDADRVTASSEFQHFYRGYIAALLWSSNDACPITGDMRDLDEYELSTAGADKCRADCLAFFTANCADIDAAARVYGLSDVDDTGYDFAGHDFALTRNHHGAGYWDAGLPRELGDRLTVAAEQAGEVNPYIGDDGEVYIQ